jgi:hypothetical protein
MRQSTYPDSQRVIGIHSVQGMADNMKELLIAK